MTEIKEKYKVRVKKITTARQTPSEEQERDKFYTPRYATEILLPFIPKHFKIWECAAGDGRMGRVFKENGFGVKMTSLESRNGVDKFNFIEEEMSKEHLDIIVTNPPYSIKDLFIEKAMEYGKPFAFLINADYSGIQIKWIRDYGCEKIIPNRRISYITPNIVNRVHWGEVWEIVKDNFVQKNYKELSLEKWLEVVADYPTIHNYETIDDIPQKLLAKYSSSQFHSMWLTNGLNLGRTETFVDIPISATKTRIL